MHLTETIAEKLLSRCKCGSTDHKKTSHHSCKFFKDKTTVNPLLIMTENEIDVINLAIPDQVNNILALLVLVTLNFTLRLKLMV